MPSKKINFEESIQRLEEIVKELESSSTNLDENIKSFEEGIKIYKSCQSYLEKAEQKIQVLSDSLADEKEL